MAFNGIGAKQNPGRWNSAEVPMVYAAESLSLAMLEMLVHLDESMLRLSYIFYEVEVSTDLILKLPQEDLPENWKIYPAPSSTKVTGDRWADEMSSLILEVPSTLSPIEQTFLINPEHPDFIKLTINGPHTVSFDSRLK
jgi:RES domain-containing protein